MTSTPFFDMFLVRYQRLKTLTGDDPNRLRDLSKNEDLDESCLGFKIWGWKQHEIKTRGYIICIVPDQFPNQFKDYNKRYKDKIEERLVNQTAPWIKGKTLGDIVKDFKKNKYDLGDDLYEDDLYYFNPYVSSSEEIFRWVDAFFDITETLTKKDKWGGLEDVEGSSGVEGAAPRSGVVCVNGARSFKYVCDVLLGNDLVKLFGRIKKLGTVYVPQSVANKHGQEFNSFLNLLHEACRAYILGLPLSTISISRAVVDRLLPVDDGKEKADLHDRIREAGWLDSSDKDRLQKIRLSANDILHGTRSGKPKSYTEDEIEKKALECLGYLKRIIQKVAEAPI